MNDYSQASSPFDSDTAGAADQPKAKPNGKDHATGDHAAGDPRTEALAEIADEIAAARKWGPAGGDDLIDLVQSDEMSFPAKQQAFRKRYGIQQKRSEKTRDKYQRAFTSAINRRVAVAEKKAEAEKVPVEERHFLDLTPEERAAELARAEQGAARLLNCPDLLGEIASTLQTLGVAGDTTPHVLTYLCMSTRVLPDPASLALRGPSSGGKSYPSRRVLAMQPRGAYYELTGASAKALIYEPRRFEHTIIFLFEGTRLQTADDNDEFAMLVRVLISEKCIRYLTVVGGDHGAPPRTVEINKDGPIVFITTTTGKLLEENETRLLSAFIPQSEKQTRAVLNEHADAENRVPPDLTEWHNLGRWLELTAGGGVAMAHLTRPLARLTRYTGDPRIHRDFAAMLALTRVHALMRAKFRQKDARGRVIAEIADYEAILQLIAASVADAGGAAVRPELRELVQAVRGRAETEWRNMNTMMDTAGNRCPPATAPTEDQLAGTTVQVTQRELANELNCSGSTVSARVSAAIDRGLLVNDENRTGRRMRLQLGVAVAADLWVFPSTARLRREMGVADLDDDIEVHAEDLASPRPAFAR